MVIFKKIFMVNFTFQQISFVAHIIYSVMHLGIQNFSVREFPMLPEENGHTLYFTLTDNGNAATILSDRRLTTAITLVRTHFIGNHPTQTVTTEQEVTTQRNQ